MQCVEAMNRYAGETHFLVQIVYVDTVQTGYITRSRKLT